MFSMFIKCIRKNCNKLLTYSLTYLLRLLLYRIIRLTIRSVRLQKFDTVSVPVERFTSRVLGRGANYRDVIRVFLKHGDKISDDDVDDLIASRVMTSHADEVDGDGRKNDVMAAESRYGTMSKSDRSKVIDDSENRLVGEEEFAHYSSRSTRVPVNKYGRPSKQKHTQSIESLWFFLMFL
jgi:hypothetical protein